MVEVVNLYSEHIKQLANERGVSYATMQKAFWKSKKLQREWKIKRDNMLKEQFTVRRPLVPFAYAPKPAPVPSSNPALNISKQQLIAASMQTPLITPKRRGRPVGSKNKPKPPPILTNLGSPAPYTQPVLPHTPEETPNWFDIEYSPATPATPPPVFTPSPSITRTIFISPDQKKIIDNRRKELKERTDMGMEDFPAPSIEGTGFEDWMPFIRRDYPPSIRKFLQQRGDEIIEKIVVGRTPLQPATNLLLQSITTITMLGKFSKRQKEMHYDDLYHLELIITTTRGTYFSLEKNEVINIRLKPKLQANTELRPITNIPAGLSINQMLNRTKELMGNKFFVYNPVSNNCQDFVMAILEANGMGTPEDAEFIKQDIPYLFEGAKRTIGFASLLSSLAAMRNRIIEGAGLYKVQSVLFNKKKWKSANDAAEWLKSHSYLNKGVDEKEDTYRFRQLNPSYIKKNGYTRFITKPLGNSGVSLILAYKK